MQWLTDEQRARQERYKQKIAPFVASMERMSEHGKAMQQTGMKMAWTGVKMTFGIILLIIVDVLLVNMI